MITVHHPSSIPAALRWAKDALTDGLRHEHPMVLSVRRERRSDSQNRLLWARLTDISEQVEWYGKKLSPEVWKDVLSAGLKRQEAVPNIDGDGFVMIGVRTSRMTVPEMTKLLDLARHFGDSKGVQWSPTSLGDDT